MHPRRRRHRHGKSARQRSCTVQGHHERACVDISSGETAYRGSAGRAMIHPRLPMTRTKFAVKANLLELDGRNIGERPRLSEAAVFISRGENRLLPARAASNWTRGRLHPDHESHRHRAGRSSLRSGRFGLALHHTTPHHTTPHHTTPHHTPRPPYGNFSTWLNLKIRLHIYT
jgi:hypothetical protein